MSATTLAPVHPGEILLEAVTVDTALRLARYFGTSDRLWLNLQASCDLDQRH